MLGWDPRQLVLVAGAFGGLAFMLTVFVKLQIGRSLLILENPPRWYTFKLLLWIGLIRPRRRGEAPPIKMIKEEMIIFAIVIIFLVLGCVLLASGWLSTAFPATIEKNTCEYGAQSISEHCGSLHENCSTPCGAPSFELCGNLTCTVDICRERLEDYLLPHEEARNAYKRLTGTVTTLHCVASLFGIGTCWMLVAAPGMFAAVRTSEVSLFIASVSSACAAPLLLALAIFNLIFGAPIREACADRSGELVFSCQLSTAEGLWAELCAKNDLGVGRAFGMELLNSVTLMVTAVICIIFSWTSGRMGAPFAQRNKEREAAERAAASPEDALRTEEMIGARKRKVKNQSNIPLVHEHDFQKFPGLMQVYRGHLRGVLNLQMEEIDGEKRLVTSGIDGTVRTWDIKTTQCLSEMKAHEGRVEAVKVFGLQGEESERVKSSVIPNTLSPEWDFTRETKTFNLGHTNKMIWIRVYNDGEGELYGSAVFQLSQVLPLEHENNCSETVTLPVFLLKVIAKTRAERTFYTREANTDRTAALRLLHTANRLGSKDNAATFEEEGDVEEARVRQMGSITLRISYNFDLKVLELQPMSAELKPRGRRNARRNKKDNPYLVISVADIPIQRLFTTGGNVVNKWSLETQRKLGSFKGHQAPVMCLTLLRIPGEGDTLFTGAMDRTARMWDAHSGECKMTFTEHVDAVTSLLVYDSGEKIHKAVDQAVTSTTTRVNMTFRHVMNTNVFPTTDSLYVTVNNVTDVPLFREMKVCRSTVSMQLDDNPPVFSPVVSGTADPVFEHEFAFENLEPLSEILVKLFTVTAGGKQEFVGWIALDVSSIKTRAMGGSCLGKFVFDYEPRHQLVLFTGSGMSDGMIRRFDLRSGKVTGELAGHRSTVTRIKFHDAYGKRRIFSASWDGTVRMWDPKTMTSVKVFPVTTSPQLTSLELSYILKEHLWIFVGCYDKTARMLKISADTVTSVTWRTELANFLDKPQVFVLIVVCIGIDLGVGLITEFAIPEDDKDCFGRDTPAAFWVTTIVLSIFTIELALRVIAVQKAFFVPVLYNKWNYFDVLVIVASIVVATFKAYIDASHPGPPDDSGPPPITFNTDFEICDDWRQRVEEDSAEGGEGDLDLNTLQKSFTAARIVARVAIGLRLLRAFVKASRIARSILGKTEFTFEGHEKLVSDVVVAPVEEGRQEHTRLFTAADDGYVRMWNAEDAKATQTSGGGGVWGGLAF